MQLKIISDSACDLPIEYLKEKDITTIPFYINSSNGEETINTVDELYKRMLNNEDEMFKTACPSVESYYNEFLKAVEKNIPVICVCISSKFSSSYSSACVAMTNIKEKYPNALVYVLDSIQNSASQGLVVQNIQELKERDTLSFEEIIKIIEDNKKSGEIIFFVDNLNYLYNGGRLGRLKNIVSKILNLKPFIHMKDGDITTNGVCIGTKKSILKVIEIVKCIIERKKEKISDYNFIVGHGANREIGEEMFKEAASRLQIEDNKTKLHKIGATTAVHTGPHTYGIGLIKKI